MSNLANIANQLHTAAQQPGLGQLFFLNLLKTATPEQLESLSKAIPDGDEYLRCMAESVATLAKERATKAA